MPYDLFISYSRRDNVNNRVTELKEQIENDYLKFAKEPLNCFFDQEEIKGMDNWPYRLQQGLKDSHLMLIILSPNYLTSTYCECEIVEYLKYEYSRGVAGDGVAQVYFMEIPGIDDEGFRAKAAQWLEKVSRRQRIDLRPWRDEGADSLKRIDVKKRLEELKESLRKRITRMRVISEVPGNLPAPNPRFVGREREMEMLHKATALGQLGVITAVHGVGGLGKTAIAFQYAYAYANFYPGGRWYLGCANETNLASVIKRLDADLNITLTEDEKKDDIRGAKRILNELYNRAVENAEKANSKSNITETVKEFIKPAVLLILDNVDHPELIQPPCSDIISGKEWLKILVTTRMGPEELGEDETTQKLLPIDELPFDDGVSLIESYQLGGRFKNSEEKEKAGEIIKLLGGFTLAVEIAALYLYEKKGRVSCAEFLDVLKSNGVDYFGEHTNKQLSHTKLISATLTPTLSLLSPEETLILSYASLLPPDSIPSPWLKTLVVQQYPKLGEEEMAGIDNPWFSTINHLLSLRLLQVVELDTESNYPRIVRMHRLIQDQIRSRFSSNYDQKFIDELIDLADNRSDYLENHWHHRNEQWEIIVLVEFTNLLLDNKHAGSPKLVKSLGQWLIFIFSFEGYKKLHEKAIELLKENVDTPQTEIAILLSNLGVAYHNLGKLVDAKKCLLEAKEIDEKYREPTHPFLDIRYNNLALVHKDLGELQEAKKLLIQALASDTKNFEPGNPSIARSQNNLALVHKDLGELQEAKKLLIQALASVTKNFEPGHPSIATLQSNLALVHQNLGELQEAKKLLIQALASDTKNFERGHPSIAIRQSNLRSLATKYYELQYYDEAVEILHKLLHSGFEPASTYHHLARICLITERYSEAKKHIESAWQIRKEAKTYSIARLLWFKIAFAFLESSTSENFIGQLKTVLLKQNAFMKWTMQPVLDHIKPHITEHQHALLSALVNAMSDKQNLEKLNVFEEWKNAEPEEIN